MRGVVKTVKAEKGFGFIRPDGANTKDLFFHVRECEPGLPFDASLQERVVQFEVVGSDRGDRAINVRGV